MSTLTKKCVVCNRSLDRFFEPQRSNTLDPIFDTKPGKIYCDLHYYGRIGYQGNGYFCSQKCGYIYGLRSIEKESPAGVSK